MPAPRITAVDALRGLVMVIMAIDHARDFMHTGAMAGQLPTDLATTTPALFLTRWITHVCAPVFMFLAGTSARLWLARPGRTVAQLSRYLLTRGAWLLLLEVVVMRIGFDMSVDRAFPVLLITLYALGGSMIVLAALVHLPPRVLVPLAAAVVLLHNAFDGVTAASLGSLSWLWTLLHQPGPIIPGGGIVIVVGYPLIPWFAVMALGYAFGARLLQGGDAWRGTALRLGIALTVAFIALRAANVYGDPSRWSVQPSPVFTLISFLNTTKYPASLSFLLMTLGPALVLLAWMGGQRLGERNALLVFGRVPLFYFVAHFFLLHVMLIAMSLLRYGSSAVRFVLHAPPSMGAPKGLFPADFGWPLWSVYLAWALCVVLMYPACRWYAGLKRRRTWWWLAYT